MEEHGVIALPAGPNVIRLLPPLVVSKDEIDLAVRALAETVGDEREQE
jgi:acetylornithine/succinyldiaminopimelate/putrescine aminotransferase